jgi:hypothetical protein
MLVLVEIESYADSDADRQILEDLMLILVDRDVVPEVISLILKPKGNVTVAGSAERSSVQGKTKVRGSWPMVRLWEMEADQLLAAGDPGLIPWVPLTKTSLSPEELMTQCRDRLAQVSDAKDRAGLIAVTQILAGLAFPDKRFLDFFGGADAMIESPVLDEVKALIRVRAKREDILAALEARFGAAPAERVTPIQTIADEARLKELHKLAITCADLDAFVAALAAGK